ncbi:HutD family protein [Erwiniaceae bacterium BAC15a-03b]|uniref:HutD family protein n=1 Tax=Winslowiella arboricola TaxID=2978220 RepID=A0A9J6PQN3_9GAMM|nr:HutD family protein [Winslowiella arboricola]MCU5772947.1 HutD family protein [Winslowiella arboricola]MCU5780625.1 HutD family protein [Winslowiella arboricola]
MMHFYQTQKLPVSKWRNGGGETREIVSFPPDNSEFGWRASIATIAASGDFSRFPGVDRVITLIDGEKVELSGPQQPSHALLLNQPFCFAGEQAISAKLFGNTSLDFNIMTRREQFSAQVVVSRTAQRSEMGVCWVIAGEWQSGAQRLSRGEGAWWEQAGETLTPLSDDAVLLFAAIMPS